MHMQGVPPNLCPHRYDPPETGPRLIIEPMDDVLPLGCRVVFQALKPAFDNIARGFGLREWPVFSFGAQ